MSYKKTLVLSVEGIFNSLSQWWVESQWEGGEEGKVGFSKCHAEKWAWALKALEDLRKGLGRYTRPWLFRELEGKLWSYSCANRYESHFVFRLVCSQCVCVDPGLPVVLCTCRSQTTAFLHYRSTPRSSGLRSKHFHLLGYLAASIWGL